VDAEDMMGRFVRYRLGRLGQKVRLVVIAGVGCIAMGLGGCVRHDCQMDSLLVDRPVIAPERVGLMLAEAIE
jgi:hypothetical protein